MSRSGPARAGCRPIIPDLDLLRHRTVLVSGTFPYDEPWLGTRTAGTKVRAAWRRTRPLVEWLADNVTGRGED